MLWTSCEGVSNPSLLHAATYSRIPYTVSLCRWMTAVAALQWFNSLHACITHTHTHAAGTRATKVQCYQPNSLSGMDLLRSMMYCWSHGLQWFLQ
jgi:hypothetical protein